MAAKLATLVKETHQPAVRFVSAEPLLEPLDGVDFAGMDWVIVGGESGRKARRFDCDWTDSLRDQVRRAGAAYVITYGARQAKGLGL